MAFESSVADRSWSELSELPAGDRREPMMKRLAAIATMEEPARSAAVTRMVRAEYELDEESLHSLTASWLRAWIDLHREDPQQATLVARAFASVFASAPSNLAMRRAAVVQTVARQSLTDAEVELLSDELPSLGLPPSRRTRGTGERGLRERVAGDTVPLRAWWRFW